MISMSYDTTVNASGKYLLTERSEVYIMVPKLVDGTGTVMSDPHVIDPLSVMMTGELVATCLMTKPDLLISLYLGIGEWLRSEDAHFYPDQETILELFHEQLHERLAEIVSGDRIMLAGHKT